MTWSAATAEVAGVDPFLAVVIERAGPARLRTDDPDGAFGALVRAIAYQQLAGKAAAAIYGRFRAVVPGPLTPEAVWRFPRKLFGAPACRRPRRRRCATWHRRRQAGSWPSPSSAACPTTRLSPG